MRSQFTMIFALLIPMLGSAQEVNFKTYSYTELFELIEAEQDSIFELSDAAIVLDSVTDSRFVYSPKDYFEPISDSI
ncbi:MAG: hypothetical protein KJO77_02165, partial [Bacteroidia bacterium]|nr:hypothetical protein [Bacteroidia bacterium]